MISLWIMAVGTSLLVRYQIRLALCHDRCRHVSVGKIAHFRRIRSNLEELLINLRRILLCPLTVLTYHLERQRIELVLVRFLFGQGQLVRLDIADDVFFFLLFYRHVKLLLVVVYQFLNVDVV